VTCDAYDAGDVRQFSAIISNNFQIMTETNTSYAGSARVFLVLPLDIRQYSDSILDNPIDVTSIDQNAAFHNYTVIAALSTTLFQIPIFVF